jgi:hypothetical protein
VRKPPSPLAEQLPSPDGVHMFIVTAITPHVLSGKSLHARVQVDTEQEPTLQFCLDFSTAPLQL